MTTARKQSNARRIAHRKRAGTVSANKARSRPLPGKLSGPGVTAIAQQLRSWSDSVLGIAGAAADVSLGAAKALLVKPGQRVALKRAGDVLRGMRETAGLSLNEVGAAINLKDPTLLELVEGGKVALPFEIILRLAAVLGRNDPISFVMRFTRSYNPEVWETLEKLGIGRFAVQAGREREFANIYRGSDLARRMSDEEFAAVLGFTKAAFELAMTFRANPAVRAAGTRRRRGAGS